MIEKYRKNYEYKDVTDEKGNASVQLVYTGKYYRNPLTALQKRELEKKSILFSMGCLLMFLIAGICSSGAGRNFWVTIPYVVSFTASISSVKSLVRRLSAMLTAYQHPAETDRRHVPWCPASGVVVEST